MVKISIVSSYKTNVETNSDLTGSNKGRKVQFGNLSVTFKACINSVYLKLRELKVSVGFEL